MAMGWTFVDCSGCLAGRVPNTARALEGVCCVLSPQCNRYRYRYTSLREQMESIYTGRVKEGHWLPLAAPLKEWGC